MSEALHLPVRKSYFFIQGIILVAVFALGATLISNIGFVKETGISPVIVGIILGLVFGNVIPSSVLVKLKPGIVFSVKYILRTAIIFYGFRITFQNILQVGTQGLLTSVVMVASTFLLGLFLGKKIFKMDPELAMLTSAGSAVCGAAAVLATESVTKADRHKSVIAVSTVVLFGTVSMFVYPALYHSGILNMTADAFGIYIGGSIHEVAQVVVAGNAVNEAAANSGIIVKMTRVMLLVPLLVSLGFFIVRKKNRSGMETGERKFPLPYFVLGFILIAALNSLAIVPEDAVTHINTADTFLLTMAMCALGLETDISKFREAGTKPIYLSAMLFGWLLIGGFCVTKLVTAYL